MSRSRTFPAAIIIPFVILGVGMAWLGKTQKFPADRELGAENLGLCKNDAAMFKGRILWSTHTEQMGSNEYSHELTLQSNLALRGYALIDATPPIETESGSKVQVLDKDALIIEMKSTNSARVMFNALDISSAYIEFGPDEYASAPRVVGLFPVAGHSEITQTPERLSTHSLEDGSYYAIDIAAPKGAKVLAFSSGTVAFRQDAHDDELACGDSHSTIFSNKVYVKQSDGFEARYVHLAKGSIRVREGQSIEAGEVIAEVGCFNGCDLDRSHLHFHVGGMTEDGVRSLPVNFIDEPGGEPLEPNVGQIRNLPTEKN